MLDEDGISEEAKAITRVIALQISVEMKRRGVTKVKMAELMNTSRAQVDRVLKAKGNITIETLLRAASFVGHDIRLQLVPRGPRRHAA
jgi:antitoxin HicB